MVLYKCLYSAGYRGVAANLVYTKTICITKNKGILTV